MNSNLIMAIAMKALKNSKSGGGTIKLDKTLKNEGMAADAKATGDAIENLNSEKANGKGISFSINESGGLRVTYDDGK